MQKMDFCKLRAARRKIKYFTRGKTKQKFVLIVFTGQVFQVGFSFSFSFSLLLVYYAIVFFVVFIIVVYLFCRCCLGASCNSFRECAGAGGVWWLQEGKGGREGGGSSNDHGDNSTALFRRARDFHLFQPLLLSPCNQAND